MIKRTKPSIHACLKGQAFQIQQWRRSSVVFPILTLTGFYLLAIQLPIYLAATHLTLSTTLHTFKELSFGVWGYGWDGWHYLKIATLGYHFPSQAFFPLYPVLVRGLDFFLPLTLAYRVNIVLLPILLYTLSKFCELLDIKENNKIYALIGFLFFPTAFFLQANFTETLFILLAALSFLAYYSNKLTLAVLMAALASATRPQGIVIGLILTFSLLLQERHRFRDLRTWVKTFFFGLTSISGFLLYFLYLQTKFGSYKIYFEAQAEWFHNATNIWHNLVSTFNEACRMVGLFLTEFPLIRRQMLDITVILFMFGLLIWTYRKLRWELWLFSLLQLMIPLMSGGTISFPRYALSAFPLLLLFGASLSKSPLRLSAYLVLSICLQTLLILMFLNNVFVA